LVQEQDFFYFRYNFKFQPVAMHKYLPVFLLLYLNVLFFPDGTSAETFSQHQPVDEYVKTRLSHLDEISIGDSLINRGIQLRDNKQFKAALEYLHASYNIGVENKNSQLRFLAINNIGLCYFFSSEFAKALDYYLQAYEIAIRDLPVNFELTILNNIAVVYKSEGNFEMAQRFLKRAYDNALELNMHQKAADYGVNLGTIYTYTGEYEKAHAIFDEAIRAIRPGTNNYFLARISKADAYEREGKPEAARHILENIVQQQPAVNDDVIVFALTRLAKVLHTLGYHRQAEQYARQGVKVSRSVDNKPTEYDAYDVLSRIGHTTGNYQMAFENLQEAWRISSEIQQLRNKEQLAELQARFELARYEYELETAEERYQSLRRFHLSLLALIILMGILIAYAARVRWINMQQKNYLLQKKEEIAALELEKSHAQHMALEHQIKRREEQAAMSEKLLREELEKKNKEVSSKALINATKNEFISQVVCRIEKLNGNGEQNIALLKQELKSTIDIEKDWEDFVMHFEQIHEGFFQSLQNKHPDLNNNDLRFLAYLRINLGGKEIARLLNITPASYRKRKMRLKEKLGLERSRELDKYIFSL
jgi:tetratricopeptide (TPR) repeat protein/DNA-binding CsgD family transcriptional regulator